MFWDSPWPDECIGGFGVTLFLHLHSEMYNWMIGCDVSGSLSSRVTDWRYREVSEDESAESESGVLLSFTLAAQAVGLHSWRHPRSC